MVSLASSKVSIAVLNVSNHNSLTKEAGYDLLSNETSSSVEIGAEFRLATSDADQGYLPQLSSQEEFRLNFYRLVPQ